MASIPSNKPKPSGTSAACTTVYLVPGLAEAHLGKMTVNGPPAAWNPCMCSSLTVTSYAALHGTAERQAGAGGQATPPDTPCFPIAFTAGCLQPQHQQQADLISAWQCLLPALKISTMTVSLRPLTRPSPPGSAGQELAGHQERPVLFDILKGRILHVVLAAGARQARRQRQRHHPPAPPPHPPALSCPPVRGCYGRSAFPPGRRLGGLGLWWEARAMAAQRAQRDPIEVWGEQLPAQGAGQD